MDYAECHGASEILPFYTVDHFLPDAHAHITPWA